MPPVSSELRTSVGDQYSEDGIERIVPPLPPKMNLFNGFLRFGLEVAALVGIGHYGYSDMIVPDDDKNGNGGDDDDDSQSHWKKILLGIIMPLIAAAIWVTFNVPNDPSRSGRAPVRVPGITRILVELLILGFGGYALGLWNRYLGGVYGGLAGLHYALYHQRIVWLLNQD